MKLVVDVMVVEKIIQGRYLKREQALKNTRYKVFSRNSLQRRLQRNIPSVRKELL